MMHPVHVGRHNKKPKRPVNGYGDVDVAVVEHGGGVEGHLEDEHRQGGRSEGRYRHEFDSHGNDDFYRMEAQACGYIEIEVCMVHHVQTPKGRNRMMENMLKINGKIEGNHSYSYFKPVGKIEVVEQPPLTLSGQKSSRHGKNGENQAHREGIETDNHKICKPSVSLGGSQRPARRKDFAKGDQKEDPEEKSQAYRYFSVHKGKTFHRLDVRCGLPSTGIGLKS
jgi:hypothetical protein